MALEIRLIKDSEYEAVNDFFNNARNIDHHCQKTKRLFENFKWEFINGPSGKAFYVVAVDNEEGKESKIIGIQCAIPLKMISSNGEYILTAKGEDTLIDIRAQIKYRKNDILKELYTVLFEECRKNGIDYIWGFTDALASFKRVGFDLPFKSFYGVLVLKPVAAFNHLVKLNPKNTNIDKAKIAALSVISYFLSFKGIFKFSQKNSYKINFDLNDNVDLFKRASTQDNLMFFLSQNNEYLKWRITDNPNNIKYKSFQIVNNENILQVQVIYSINKNVAFIEQILFDRNLNRKILYSFIIKLIYKENICLIRFIGFEINEINKKEMSILKSFGFVFTKKGEQFAFRSLSDKSNVNPYNILLSRLYKQGIN